MKADGSLLDSGMQWIDPGGEDSGDGPIHVYCDFVTGKPFETLQTHKISLINKPVKKSTTSISHDSQNVTIPDGIHDKSDTTQVKNKWQHWPNYQANAISPSVHQS